MIEIELLVNESGQMARALVGPHRVEVVFEPPVSCRLAVEVKDVALEAERL